MSAMFNIDQFIFKLIAFDSVGIYGQCAQNK